MRMERIYIITGKRLTDWFYRQKKKNARIGKIVLIVALAIIIGPVLIPIIGGILAAGLAMVLSIIVGVFALVIAGAAIAIVGIVIFKWEK